MKISNKEILNAYKGDKRSKEYRALKEAAKKEEYESFKENHAVLSTGPKIGDKIEAVTKATGIKKVVDTVFDALGKDCGCEARKEKLNELFRGRKPECFTEAEFDLMKMAIDTRKNKFSAEEVKTYAKIYERIFRTKVECTQCSFRNTVWNALVKVYNEYS
jgi:hypothetical protein